MTTLLWALRQLFKATDYRVDSERVHRCVYPDTPIADRPYLEYEDNLDVTLGEVLASACPHWRIDKGAHMMKVGARLVDEFYHSGLVRVPDEACGVEEQIGLIGLEPSS